jgi:hypothetical protein
MAREMKARLRGARQEASWKWERGYEKPNKVRNAPSKLKKWVPQRHRHQMARSSTFSQLTVSPVRSPLLALGVSWHDRPPA